MTPPSPSASLYAMSDDEEGDYNTISHKRSGKGVKLLYSKSKVYIHPSPSSKDNLAGFIALIQQKGPATERRPSSSSTPTTGTSNAVNASSLLLAWVPESSLGDAYETYVKVDLAEPSSTPKQSYLVPPLPTTVSSTSVGTYAFAVPVSEIYSLLIRPPSIGWWYGSVVINTRAGDSFPALFFHDNECQSTILQRKKLVKESFDPFSDGKGVFWGGDEVLRWLRQYINVEKSSHDASIYLIEPSEEDRLGFGSKKDKKEAASAQASPTKPSNRRDGGMDPVTKALKEARWNILEKLSQVTTFTRRTAQAVADHPSVPNQVKRLINNPDVVTLSEEFDSARLYLARWAMGIAEQSERDRNQRIWTAQDVLEMEDSELGEFEILDVETGGLSLEDKRKPVTMKEWEGFFDAEGRLQNTQDEVKGRIFHGGLDPNDGVRQEAWLFLLGVYDWDSSRDERQAVLHSKRDEYIRLKGAWWERMADGSGTLEEREYWRDQKQRIEKDVHRTDRNVPIFAGEDIPHPDPDSPFAEVGTNVHLEQMKDMLLTYNEYNEDLGYVQGMSDLLAPIYAIMQDDAMAFWAFAGFMERMERNFLRDQSGMRLQLLTLDHLVQLIDPKLYLHLQQADSTNFFFFFRMLLVWYKREFVWEDVLGLWERLWTDFYSSNYHLFIALSILEKHRGPIMEHLKHFDEVLKYINDLSNNIDLPSTLSRAERLFLRFQRTVEAIDRKSHFPAPSISLRARKPQAELPHPPDATLSEIDDSKNKAGKQPPQPGGFVGAIAAIGAYHREPGRPNTSQATRPHQQNPTAKGKGPASGATSGSDASAASARDENADKQKKVISPELRDLLSRKIPKLDKSTIKAHGGGIN